MSKLQPFSLKIQNFKCFGGVEQGFEKIKPINLILGRNNSGKSTLLDFIEQFSILASRQQDGTSQLSLEIEKSLWRKPSQAPKLLAEIILSKEYLNKNFVDATYISQTLYNLTCNDLTILYSQPYRQSASLWDIGKNYIGCKAVFEISITQSSFGSIQFSKKFSHVDDSSIRNDIIQRISRLINDRPDLKAEYDKLNNCLIKSAEQELSDVFDPFSRKIFKRIHPDRNISPEEDKNCLDVNGNGEGITNIIQNFYNNEDLDRNKIEISILGDLNKIFKDDAEFSRIILRKKLDGLWEIALEEERKGMILLSQSGSSLKTVILILVYIHLIPEFEKNNLSSYVFSIEEIENNLHPSLLRRLLSFLSDKAKKDGCCFFMATHSSVVIDMFSHDEDAQIIHVTHNGKTSSVQVLKTHKENFTILDDLGVRASDLLQANGIVWVEGPSDIIYIEKWLEMYCIENQKSVPRRGLDYEFQMFGGTLLDSLCLIKEGLNEEEEYKKLVSMFSFSRNAFVVIDSDAVKKNKKIIDQSKFSPAKQFIKKQFEQLSADGLKLGLWFKDSNTEIRTLEDYLDRDTIKEYKAQKSSNKTKKIYAQTVTSSWSETKILDDFRHNLKDEIKALYQTIQRWNK
jgi:putative ATP-dependent endonuclease of the OLD family